jgi:hypothetical protein
MPRGYRQDALVIFLLFAFLFAYFIQDPGWNENSRFDLIFASVEEKTLSIDHYYNAPGTETGDHAYVNGHYYSDKAIGPAVLGVLIYQPLLWIHDLTGHIEPTTMKEILTFMVIGLPSAIAGTLIYLLCLYLSRKRLRSFLITLGITLGTLYFPYSGAFFSHQLTSSLIFSVFFLMFFIKEKIIQPKGILLFLIGLLMGWAFISEFQSLVILFPLAIYYLVILWKNPAQPRGRSILWPVLGALIPIALQLIYDQICFGNPFSIGYQNLDNYQFKSSMGKGLMGIGVPDLQVLFYMTFHPTLGLFWQSPVLILAFAGVVFGLHQRNYRGEILMAIWIIVSYLVMMSGYFMWWGGYALGVRNIIPIIPFFCLLLVFLPDAFNWPLAGLGLISAGQMFLAAATTIEIPDDHISQLATMKFFQYSNIYNYCLQQFSLFKFNTNLGNHLLKLKYGYSLIPFFVVFLVMILIFFRKEILSHHKIEVDPLQ